MSIYRVQTNRLSPAAVLLGFLYENPSHGYELHQRLGDEFGYIWRVSQSQMYNILNRLESQGYISSAIIDQEKLPPRQMLKLTEAGRNWFDTWLAAPTRCSVHAIRVEFITRLYFIQRYFPEKILETVDEQLEEVKVGLNRLASERAGLPDDQQFNRLALDLRIELLRSIFRWLEESRGEFSFER